MGSAALYQLAKRGAKVLGIDRFAPPHDHGSSHGDTRITRLAIGEGAYYTPLVTRSHEIWREIEREAGATLLTQCGGLIISNANPASHTHVPGFFQNTVSAARNHGIRHELLESAAIRSRFPQFNVRDDEFGYFEPDAGFVRPEACIASQLALAQRGSADVRRSETVFGFGAGPNGVSVKTDRGFYQGDKLIVAAGAWLPKLLGGDFEKLLAVYRQVLHWFDIDGEEGEFGPGHFPVFIWELPDSLQGIYGFPVVDSGLKIATEQYTATTLADSFDRGVAPFETAAMYADFVAPYLKGVSGRSIKSATCLYTVTPDAGFIVDHLPTSERVIVASCCSGHGFKHSAAIGEVLAELAEDRRSSFDLSPFRLSRFSA